MVSLAARPQSLCVGYLKGLLGGEETMITHK